MDLDGVRLDVDDRIATITLSRPERRNALSLEMLRTVIKAFEAVPAETGVVILAAEGPAFSAGHDMAEMIDRPDDYYAELFATCTRMMEGVHALPQPVIARVQGVATAAGCQLVATCDLAVASSEARFAVSGVNYGLFCSTPSVALSRNLARKQAMEMLLTGDFIDAEEARVRGLVNRVVTPDRLDEEVEVLAAKIVAKAPVAVRIGKEQFYRQVETGVAEAYAIASEAMACNMMEEAALDGVQAFIDRKKA